MTKSREIPTVLANQGMEKGVRTLIVETYERLAALEQTTQELAMMQLQIIKSVEQVVNGASAMRAQVERLQNRGPNDADDLPN